MKFLRAFYCQVDQWDGEEHRDQVDRILVAYGLQLSRNCDDQRLKKCRSQQKRDKQVFLADCIEYDAGAKCV